MPARLTGPRAYWAALGRGAGRWLLNEWRAFPLYRRVLLSGPAPDSFKARPRRLTATDPARGQAILEGRFPLAGLELDAGQGGDPWDSAAPSRRFAERLHAFEWLGDLLALDTPEAAIEARRLTDAWIAAFGRGFNAFSWSPDIAGERLRNWILASRQLYSDADSVNRSRRLVMLAVQGRHLARTGHEAEPGLKRLTARSAAALAGLCLGWRDAKTTALLTALAEEIDGQILEDGIHASRSPEATLAAAIELSLVEDALAQQDIDAPDGLDAAMARFGPALRFFRHRDGRLAAFNGGGEGDADLIETALAREDSPGRVFAVAPHGNFLRAEGKGATLIMDGGGSPPAELSAQAHAGALSFEFSAQGQRLIVNCGWSPGQPGFWRDPARASAAHSTLIVADTSSSRIVPEGLGRRLTGARLKNGSLSLDAKARDGEAGAWLDAAHDGYLAAFGLIHRRRVFLSGDGEDLRGEDTLDNPAPSAKGRAEPLNFVIRFHLPPGVKASISRDGASVLLVTPRGEGWRFRTDHPPVRLERSAYLAAGAPPARSEQMAIYGVIPRKAERGKSLLRVRWALQRVRDEE